MNNIDHFSINVVPENNEMLIFSIKPEIAYTLYSSRLGIQQDLAISPTFYKNFDFYFWDDCYEEKSRREIMLKKEKRFGIKAGTVIVHENEGVKYLLSFGTKTNEDNFRQDMITKKEYFKSLGIDCLKELNSSISKYLSPQLNGDSRIIKLKGEK